MSLFVGASAIAAAVASSTAVGLAAKYGANATRDAARETVAATNHAADLQARANDAALAETRRQADLAYRSSELARRGNYDQWAAQQRRYSSIGELVGLAPREIPAYVGEPDPMFGGAPSTSSAAAAGGAAGQLPTLGATFDPRAAEAAYRIAYPDGRAFDASYWAREWPGLVARGQQTNDPAYATKRLMGWQAGGGDVALAGPFAGGAGAPAAAIAPRSAPAYAAVGDYLVPRASLPMTAPLALPAPQRYGAVGSYL